MRRMSAPSNTGRRLWRQSASPSRRVAEQLSVQRAGHPEVAREHEPQRQSADEQRLRDVERDELPGLERDAQHVVREQREQREGQRHRADAQVLRVDPPAEQPRGHRLGEDREQQRDRSARDEPEQERRRHHADARLAPVLLVEEPRQRPVHAEHEHEQRARRVRDDDVGHAVLLGHEHAREHGHEQQVDGLAAHLPKAVDERVARQAPERVADAHRAPAAW
jgi:hypothetical protein